MARGKLLTKEEKAQICDLKASGWEIEAISAKVGRPKGTLYKVLRLAGMGIEDKKLEEAKQEVAT
jgi:IS30 family transposase